MKLNEEPQKKKPLWFSEAAYERIRKTAVAYNTDTDRFAETMAMMSLDHLPAVLQEDTDKMRQWQDSGVVDLPGMTGEEREERERIKKARELLGNEYFDGVKKDDGPVLGGDFLP